MVWTKESATQKNLLNGLLLCTGGSSVLLLFVLAIMAAADWITWGVFGAAVSGLIAGNIIGQATAFFTSDTYKPTQDIVNQIFAWLFLSVVQKMKKLYHQKLEFTYETL